MPRRQDWEEDADDEFDEEEGFGDDDDVETVACPYCRRQIYEDAERCPYCERYISDQDAPLFRKPWWMLLGVAVCLYIVYRWIVG